VASDFGYKNPRGPSLRNAKSAEVDAELLALLVEMAALKA
jgi:hypothetical protein